MKNLALLIFTLLMGVGALAQKVFIDQPIRIGEFIVFPSVDDPNAFYYSPNKPRVAKSKNGKPQFSFLLFKEKNRSEVTEENIEDQIGGGIVHALVEYGLTDSQVERLRSMLKEINKEAVLKGPLVYKSGNIALVSAIADKNNGHVTNVIGVGKAPVLENQKASIAFILDTKGAKLLWSSFQTETPDIDFKFEMEMSGYISPINGYLKGSFNQIYESHDMSLAASGSLGPITLGAEIGATFDKLRREGKIKVYTEGDDKEMQRLIMAGYKSLAKMMFEPLNQSYSQMVNNDPSKNNASAFEQLSKLKVLEDDDINPLNKAQAMEDWKSGRKTDVSGAKRKEKANADSSKRREKANVDSSKKDDSIKTKNSEILPLPDNQTGSNNMRNRNAISKQVQFAGGKSLRYLIDVDLLETVISSESLKEDILNIDEKKGTGKNLYNSILPEVYQDSRSKYENRHKDLVELRYRKKWVKSSGNQSVLVSLRHANIVVKNWKEAFKESRNNSAKGRKWLLFNPTGTDDEVSMEAWRFRGLVDICTISVESRNELKDYLREQEDEVMQELNTEMSGGNLENEVDEIVDEYATEEDENLGLPDMPLNSGAGNLARDVDDTFEEFENVNLQKNDNGTSYVRIDEYEREMAIDYNKSNKDLMLVQVKKQFVENKKLLLDDKYIYVSMKHLETILNDCENAKYEASINRDELYIGAEYVPYNDDYESFEIDPWRLKAIVRSYCSEERVTEKMLKFIQSKVVLGNPNRQQGRYLVIGEKKLLQIFDNYLEAENELNFYKASSEQNEDQDNLLYKFGIFGEIEPSQFAKAVEFCRDEEIKSRIVLKIKARGKGGPSLDDYFDYDGFVMTQNRVKFLNKIKALSLNELQQSSPAPFSIYATYKFRQTKIEGDFNLEFNKVSAGTQPMYFSENIGNIKEQCESCFKIVSLDEMEMFKQREVLVILDGSILSNFKKFINSASITLRKEHPEKKFENEYTNITYTNFKDTGNVHKMVYGWQGDDSETWGNYQYKVDWNFFQNYEVKGEFQDYDGDVLSISPPVSLKTVSIEADPDFVADNNIKYITIKLSYGYGTRKQSGYVDLDAGGQFVSKPIRLRADGILSKQVGLILPNDSDEFSYTYKVTTNEGKSYQSGELKSNGLLIDEIHEIPVEE